MRRRSHTNTWTLFFVMCVSIISAGVLALLASGLKATQEKARELDRCQQLLLSAGMYSADGFFTLPGGKASYAGNGRLVLGAGQRALASEVFAVYRHRVRPYVVSRKGELRTYAQAGLDMAPFLASWKGRAAASDRWLPIFAILPNEGVGAPESYVIPIAGMGLWDRIFGYIAIATDGETVRGTAWYEHKETPGLGGEISSAQWQAHFCGKKIFQPEEDGTIDAATAPLGIRVVKGRVEDLYGAGPKAKNSVDGISGATLTGRGVSAAYADSLEPYRPFFIQLRQA